MRWWYLSNRRPVKVQASLRICAVSPEPSLFAHIRGRVRPKIRHLAPHWMAANVCLKNEFTEDEKCHNLMSWLHCAISAVNKTLISLQRCTGWSALLLFAYGIRQIFSWCGSYIIRVKVFLFLVSLYDDNQDQKLWVFNEKWIKIIFFNMHKVKQACF